MKSLENNTALHILEKFEHGIPLTMADLYAEAALLQKEEEDFILTPDKIERAIIDLEQPELIALKKGAKILFLLVKLPNLDPDWVNKHHHLVNFIFQDDGVSVQNGAVKFDDFFPKKVRESDIVFQLENDELVFDESLKKSLKKKIYDMCQLIGFKNVDQ